MAEIVGLVASVATLSKLAQGVCIGLRELHGLLGELPGRLAALGNEVDDARVVLNHLSLFLKQRQHHPSGAGADHDDADLGIYHDMSLHTTKLHLQLSTLDDILGEIWAAGQSSKLAPARRAFAWKKHHGRLNDVQDQIVAAKAHLHLILDTAATLKLDQVDIRLGILSETRTIDQSDLQALISNHHQDLKKYIAEQLALTQSRMHDSSPRLPRLHPNVAKLRAKQASMSKEKSQIQQLGFQQHGDSVRVGIQSSQSWCDRSCPCDCHDTRRAQTPTILNNLLGQLFLNYSSMPMLSPKCNHAACKQTTSPKVQAEFWFPAHVFWSKILHIQAAYQAATGPSLQLRTFRHVPDSAPVINYTINGNVKALKALFGQGLASPVDVSDTRGYSLLRWAIYSQQWETCRFLYAQGADADYRPKASSDNSPRNKASDLLLQGGLGSEATEALSQISRREDWLEDQNLPLLHKIVLGISGGELVQELRQNPAVVNNQDAMGRTALLWAAARGDDETVATLLHFKADPNIMDCQHAGPVSYAADRNHTVCARMLLAAGADPDPIIPGGYKIGSPLNCAARNAQDPLLIRVLLEHGADVNACGVDGRTSLIHAARTDNVEFAQVLLEYNANINAVSSARQTPLTTAIVHNSHSVLSLLLERWHHYSVCPRLAGPNLLKITAQYDGSPSSSATTLGANVTFCLADLETMLILCDTDHLRLKHDEKYTTGDFETLLDQRPDLNEKMKRVYMDLMATVRAQVVQQAEPKGSLMEKGFAG
ncbi:hypothetical protein LLEC1_06479 [Akanthomyces lecanii]|uniref:Uncharacterized protein n=1 Tax=Cordyceps confragosa TaxID=2714763 RepID=A0A179IBE4_CORDF|nr:hypothetical protein LLEC1_06479 [Akanthomyces lecanii]